jgi:hypothetical protein
MQVGIGDVGGLNPQPGAIVELIGESDCRAKLNGSSQVCPVSLLVSSHAPERSNEQFFVDDVGIESAITEVAPVNLPIAGTTLNRG